MSEEQKESVVNPYERACRHCGQPMSKWLATHNDWGDGMGFCTDIMLVCFNDECPIYVKGWNTLYDKYRKVGSVRHFYNPDDGFQGVLPVGHKDALRGDIVA
ncbi:hypothetical protein [Candidatus Magnetaquicoccus inordinatus]|uniref:hypothetical protein n=1 Tax=Candidatus Magnetaquicoccus inordinatus TaxID=2496818 RepID=UPI00102AEA6E|nr:hypothetical protein [Candidatus Magnetaquicoccus inordinatus]